MNILFIFLPRWRYKKIMAKYGEEGRYQRERTQWDRMHFFHDLESY